MGVCTHELGDQPPNHPDNSTPEYSLIREDRQTMIGYDTIVEFNVDSKKLSVISLIYHT